MDTSRLGLQLYSIRGAMEEGFYGALKRVAEIGYRFVQFHGMEGAGRALLFERTEAVRRWLDELNLKAIYLSIPNVEDSTVAEAVRAASALGCERLCLPFWQFDGREDVLSLAAKMNRAGARCRKDGIALYYHHHFHEFAKLDGVTPLELLLENTSPENVRLELDIYWASRGGMDPLRVFDRWKERIDLVHLKNVSMGVAEINLFNIIPEGTPLDAENFAKYALHEDAFTELANGQLNVPDIAHALAASGRIQHFSVEQDYSRIGEIESARRNFEAVRSM